MQVGSVVTIAGEEFEILEQLGRGGMGCVYKAMRRALHRLVAIKFIFDTDDSQGTQRFLREAKMMAGLSHPNIVRIDAVKAEGAPFIVMELVEGQTLAELLQESHRLNQEKFVSYFSQLLSALQYLHDEGLVHRDIKPSNIMITTDDTIKLMDFGIAKDLCAQRTTSQSMTRTGAIVGSPWYMSPEQCRAEQLDARSDLYSVGCVMYEALTGKPPFQGENALEVMYAHITSQISTESELALPAFSQLVMKAIEKEPEKRFQTAAEMRELLTLKESATQPSRRIKSHKKSSLKTRLPLLLAVTAAIAGLAATLYMHSTDQPKNASSPEYNQSAHSLYDKGRDSEKYFWDQSLPQTERDKWGRLAISQYQEALKHNPNEKVEYDCNSHASSILRACDPKEGEQNANQALAVIKQYRFDRVEYLHALDAVIHYKRIRQDWNSVIELSQEKIRERPSPLVLRALDTVQIAAAFEQKKESGKADSILQQMLKDSESADDKIAEGVTASGYALIQQMRLNFPEAIRYAQLAVNDLRNAQANRDIGKLTLRDTLLRSEMTLAITLEQSNRFDEAKKVSEDTIASILRDTNVVVAPNWRLCELYAGLTRFYERKKDWPKYFENSDKAIEYCQKSKHIASALPLFNTRFWNELSQGDLKAAKNTAHRMLDFGQENPNKFVRAWAFALVGRTELLSNNLDAARRRLDRAEVLAKEEQSRPTGQDLTDLFLTIYSPRAQTEMRSGDVEQTAHYMGLLKNASEQATANPTLKQEAIDTWNSYQKAQRIEH